MQKLRHIFFLTVTALSLVACEGDFLSTQPLDKISSEATWADGALSEAFIFNVYSFLGYGGFEEQGLSSITDEAMFTHAGRNINTFNEGSETPSNLAWVSSTYEWGNMFLAIRQANLALENLPTATFTNEELKERLLGEARFLRAYYYHQLLRFYGGFPIIDRPYGLNEDYNVARATFAECVDFIVNDLDEAATLLDGKEETPGRASR
ncbi:MAG: RagB/SusD family nutrient uptake outer membrane protein, partial [Bacteroidetes bacterium]